MPQSNVLGVHRKQFTLAGHYGFLFDQSFISTAFGMNFFYLRIIFSHLSRKLGETKQNEMKEDEYLWICFGFDHHYSRAGWF